MAKLGIECCPICCAPVKAIEICNSVRFEYDGPRWISVEERMPEHMDDVLVWVGGLAEVGCYDENNECWELYTYVGDGSVTYWMRLPEPPKEAP